MEIVEDLTRKISSIASKRSGMIKSNLKELHHRYTFSEMHTIDYIGKHKKANVTKISEHLKMTRGAISKITKRLLKNDHIESYKVATNKKEIYYNLTSKGKKLFKEHDEIHIKFNQIDSEYFSNIDEELLESFNTILSGYSDYLSEKADVFDLSKSSNN